MVGGTALTGGMGGVTSTVAGALFVTELTSFSNIVRVSTGAQCHPGCPDRAYRFGEV